jgi:hypothetical protein
MDDQTAFAIALNEAKISYKEGGVPVRALSAPGPSLLLASRGSVLTAETNRRLEPR